MPRARSVYVETRGDVAEVVFNRPEILNAANHQWVDDFRYVLDDLEAARGLRVVVVSGAGRSFSTGIDLKALAAGEIPLEWFRQFDENVRRLELLDAVTIAKIRGYALGGGLQVTLGCDLRIAAEDARFGLPAVLESLVPGMGTWRLPRFIGLGRARRLALTGELVGAEEAQRIGLVDMVAPEADLDQKTQSVIADLQKGSHTAQRLTKRLVTRAFDSNYDEALSECIESQRLALESEDHRGAMAEYRTRRGLPQR